MFTAKVPHDHGSRSLTLWTAILTTLLYGARVRRGGSSSNEGLCDGAMELCLSGRV